jgi:hypothetical protein
MAGLSLITVPSIVYGGLVVLGVITQHVHGLPSSIALEPTPLQVSLYRAGHAHAGVLAVLGLVVQVLLDSASLPERVKWIARLGAPTSAILVSAGFFGIAHFPALAPVLWAGATSLVVTVSIAGVGLLRKPLDAVL